MKLCDRSTVELINGSYAEHTDLYISPAVFPTESDITEAVKLTGRKTVCLFPAVPVVPDKNMYCIFENGHIKGNIGSDIVFADAAALFYDEFTSFMTKNVFDEIILLFADCAEKYSYGFSNGMRNIAEIRAASPLYMHLTAVFADNTDGKEKDICKLFGSEKYFSFSEKSGGKFNSVETASRKRSFAFIAEEYEKSVMGHTAVFFDDRLSAESFSVYMNKHNIPCSVFHGGKSDKAKAEAVGNFTAGDKGIIAVTKSFLPTSVFCGKFNAVYCGIPVTDTFAKQILRSCGQESLDCVYCKEDIIRSIKIRLSMAALLPESEQKAFSGFRSRKLSDMIDLFNKN